MAASRDYWDPLRLRRFLTLTVILLKTSQMGAVPYAWETKLSGPQSPYTEVLVELAKRSGPTPPKESRDDNPAVTAECFETPGNEFYIGLGQRMIVEASLASIDAIVSDFSQYSELFPSLKKVEVNHKDQNLWVVAFEQNIPVFFIPNLKYEMYYLFDRTKPNRTLFRYQLKSTGELNFSDGIIVLEKISENRTRYIEYDFFDGNYGILKTFAPGRIWEDSVHDILLSDVVVKLKAENPELENRIVVKKAQAILEAMPIKEIIKKRKKFDPPVHALPIPSKGN